jgi:anti-sigma factor RsiW
MTWTCEQTELRLSDYLDRSLTTAEVQAFEAHVPTCPRCTPLLASVTNLVTRLHGLEPVDEPARLVYSILDRTLGPRESQSGWRGLLAWTHDIASLRFVYGALSVAATFLILVTASGFNWRHPKLADLRPSSIYYKANRNAHLVKASTIKFVSDLRVVNEIQSRLRQDNELPTLDENTAPESKQPKDRGHSDTSKPSAPRQQNRANDLARHLEVLAMYVPARRWNVSAVLTMRSVL